MAFPSVELTCDGDPDRLEPSVLEERLAVLLDERRERAEIAGVGGAVV
ncbi:MAG: hypothetical protein AAGI53_09480 [Planctomycetota bacterium]